MHTLHNLSANTAEEWSVVCAQSILFLHVCALDKTGLGHLLRARSLQVPPLGIRNPRTVESEDALGIQPSVYFYAGRSYPAPVGTIACSIALSDWDGANERPLASPFDTGGLHHDKLKLKWQDYSDEGKKEYLDDHTSSLDRFTDYFALFLSAYFDNASGYWDSPTVQIDGVDLTNIDDWRNWTFELREANATSITQAKWYFDYESHSHYLDLLLDGSIEPIPSNRYEIVSTPFAHAEEYARIQAVAAAGP